jgi:hypothetical protein
MRASAAKVFPATALLLALTVPGLAARRPKEPHPQTPLEFKIFGPGFIYPGQQVKYKAVLTNRSSEPIVIAARDAPWISPLSRQSAILLGANSRRGHTSTVRWAARVGTRISYAI